MSQYSLFERPSAERFEKFHAEHPEVYAKLVQLARDARSSGLRHYGMRALWERMRWHFQVENRDEDFKLNDHYPPYYSRLIMQREKDLEGFFETRGYIEVISHDEITGGAEA